MKKTIIFLSLAFLLTAGNFTQPNPDYNVTRKEFDELTQYVQRQDRLLMEADSLLNQLIDANTLHIEINNTKTMKHLLETTKLIKRLHGIN